MKKLFLLLAALTLSFQVHAASDADNTTLVPPQPKLAFLARFSVDLVAPIWELGKTSDLGRRRIIPITGGVPTPKRSMPSAGS